MIEEKKDQWAHWSSSQDMTNSAYFNDMYFFNYLGEEMKPPLMAKNTDHQSFESEVLCPSFLWVELHFVREGMSFAVIQMLLIRYLKVNCFG